MKPKLVLLLWYLLVVGAQPYRWTVVLAWDSFGKCAAAGQNYGRPSGPGSYGMLLLPGGGPTLACMVDDDPRINLPVPRGLLMLEDGDGGPAR